MFIQLTETEIKGLEVKNLAQPISRWETIEKAKAYYSNVEGIFSGYKIKLSDLKTAYSTPILVFKLNKQPPI
ncbi:hypothetical protein [Paenibacillus sp. BC26]|uniref:hypothetical protein n=1 Tax=Paenibacillus sp. BC26 TaxID=1881032 RepID=UPI000B86E1EF|nr:hypothetical protein [Paenibacillus sp. BC26]